MKLRYVAVVVAAAVLASGCGSSGSNGTNGSDGTGVGLRITDLPAGGICPFGGQMIEAGPDANRDGLPDTVTSTKYICNAGDPATASKTVKASIDTVKIVPGAGSVTMNIDFTVKNGAGNEIVGLLDADVQDGKKTAHLAFNLAKLLPGANGDANTWRAIASSATLTGFTNKGGGHYAYTTEAITTSGTVTSAKYDSTLRTRVVLRVMPNDSQADTWTYSMGHLATLANGASANYDIPNGSTATKDVVRTASCLECHNAFGGKSSFHAGQGDVTTETCVACHDAAAGTPAGDGELGQLVHKIHTAQAADGHDYTTVTYPQDVRNCGKCHKNGADSGNWVTKPTMAACGSCHGTVDFATGASHTGGAQSDNSQCAGCHTPALVAGKHTPVTPPDPNNIYAVPVTGNPNTNAASIATSGVLPAGADRITYVIKSVDAVTDFAISPNKRPAITFKFQKNGADVVFDNYVGGLTTELMPGFVGSPSVYFAWAVPQDYKSTPADFNAAASGYIRNIWNGTAVGSGAGIMTGPDGEGFYTIKLTGVQVVSNATLLTGGIGYTLSLTSTRPLTQIDLPGYPYSGMNNTGGLIVPAPNVWKVATGYTGRRVIVDTDRCNTCHGMLGTSPVFHAGQRNDAPTCSFCHNPNRTVAGWPDNAGSLIHGIHAKSLRTVPFTWQAAATLGFNTYPGVLNNCEQCHVPGGYDYSGSMYTGNQTVANMQLVTSAAGVYSTDPLTNSVYLTSSPYVTMDGVQNYGNGFSHNAATATTTQAAGTTLVQSPVTAVCVSCHDSTIAVNHMTSNGGVFYAKRSDVLSPGGVVEQCIMCHGSGKVAAIKDVHSK